MAMHVRIHAPRGTRKRGAATRAARSNVVKTRAKSCDRLDAWLAERGVPKQPVKPEHVDGRLGCVATRDVMPGEQVLRVPQEFAITAVDVAEHPEASAAKEHGDLVGLALWLLAEQARGESSEYAPYVETFAGESLSPLLWTQEERDDLLKGSPTKEVVDGQLRELEKTFEQLQQEHFEPDPDKYPSRHYNLESFKRAFVAVLSRTIYLPSADCFALVPLADMIKKPADGSGGLIDFSIEEDAVVMTTPRSILDGEEILAGGGIERSSGEMLIVTGHVDADAYDTDYLNWDTELVQADKLYSFKKQILEDKGLSTKQSFPVYVDRIPRQLLSFLRLSRVQDPSDFFKISFEEDQKVSEANEYEVLMLMMAECQERMGKYGADLDNDFQIKNNPESTPKDVVAADLRINEKRVLRGTMDGIRRRLAPIRKVPTKKGMQDPNQDIIDMFNELEKLPGKPKEFLTSLLSRDKGKDKSRGSSPPR
uniref:Rubisco LSMT substrate-binding domain-containing protein n=1 Tax=Picocystis salinarum TaxID=88271 RepID=A0A7S3UAG2_9CHLO